MLNGIAWDVYLAGAGLLSGAYYLAIVLLYYRQEVKLLFFKKAREHRGISAGGQAASDNDESGDFSPFDKLEQVASDIRHGILEQAGKEASKQDLLVQIKARLASYGGLRQPACRVAINNYIIYQAQEICGAVYSEEELEAAWETLPR